MLPYFESAFSPTSEPFQAFNKAAGMRDCYPVSEGIPHIL
jgi:hypothetical protein